MEKLTNEEYDLLVDVLYECEKDLVALEKTIAALKGNRQYRGLFRKDYLKRKESEKSKIDMTIRALNHLRDAQN